MFKKVLLFATLCTLTACSDDVYDEMNQQNEQLANDANNGGMQTNSFDDTNPGWINPGGGSFINPGYGYQSPWDIWFRNHPFTPIYSFSNRGGGGHTSPLKLEIIPYVGLAYFDDNDDGNYTDLYLAQQTGGSGIVANMNNGNYPTLFFNNQEVGNLVAADPITLDGTSIDESELTIASDPSLTTDEHLLMNPANKHASGFNNLNKVFSFTSSGLTPQEEDLLMKYGKVFYYEVRITESATGIPVGTAGNPNGFYYVQMANPTLNGPLGFNINWIQIPGYNATIPSNGAVRDVHYYHNTDPAVQTYTEWTAPYPTSNPPVGTYVCNSREVVIKEAFPFRDSFSYGGRNWIIYVIIPIGSYLWQTSGPMLVVEPM